MGFSPALDRLWDWPEGSPVQAQFLHGRGRLRRPAVLRGEVLRVSGSECPPRSVVKCSCCLGSVAGAQHVGQSSTVGLLGGPACLDWPLPVSPAFMQLRSRSQWDGAAWFLLVSSLSGAAWPPPRALGRAVASPGWGSVSVRGQLTWWQFSWPAEELWQEGAAGLSSCVWRGLRGARPAPYLHRLSLEQLRCMPEWPCLAHLPGAAGWEGQPRCGLVGSPSASPWTWRVHALKGRAEDRHSHSRDGSETQESRQGRWETGQGGEAPPSTHQLGRLASAHLRLQGWLLECGPWTTEASASWGLLRKADSQAPPGPTKQKHRCGPALWLSELSR